MASDKVSRIDRRDFLRGAAGVGATLSLAENALAKNTTVSGRVIGANDRINVAVIGQGARGHYLSDKYKTIGEQDGSCKIVAVCDLYGKRLAKAKEFLNCDGTMDYRELLARKDVDAVVVATPEHWHARMVFDALAAGKDIYCEKPMCHTVEETRNVVNAVRKTQRIVQVGSQTTSADQWHKARKAIADGAIGQMTMSQGSYHRNGKGGEWNWPIDQEAGPDKKGDDYIDWKTWLGTAPSRPFSPDRYFRWRKYWDYSGGIATDLFFHVVAPLNICWGEPQFPYRVTGSGGIYVYKDGREVPDTFHLVAEYPKGHSLVLSSTMTNAQHIPGLIRGHFGSVVMVEDGMFERYTDHITVKPERTGASEAYLAKFGKKDIVIPVAEEDVMVKHIKNFLECVRTRKKPVLDVETAARAQVTVTMAVESYRQGKVMYFDEANWKVVDRPPKVEA